MPYSLERYKDQVRRHGPEMVMESATELSEEERAELARFIRQQKREAKAAAKAARAHY